jgi:hypothetical protein
MLNSPPPSLAPEPAKIPLTIGFANLSGDDLDPIASEDSAALSPLFARSRVVPAHNIPSADILFIYAHLNDDGTLMVPTMRYGIQQVAQITNAAVVVLASPNPRFGLAVQDVMLRIKPEILDPKLALAIVMESAIAMSKVDFGAL